MSGHGRNDQPGHGGLAENPERLAIAAEIAEAPKSAAQVAEATGLSLARVRKHIRAMREEGRIDSVMRKSNRGTIEHFNLLAGGLWEDEEGLGELSLAERRRLHGNILKVIFVEATRALVTHPTDRALQRLNGSTVRMPFYTDEAGWDEMAKLHREFFDRIWEARAQIAARLEEEGEKGFKASSVLLLFEAETTD